MRDSRDGARQLRDLRLRRLDHHVAAPRSPSSLRACDLRRAARSPRARRRSGTTGARSARSRRAGGRRAPSSIFTAISGCWIMIRRMSPARIASARVGSSASTLAERVSPPNIASSPKMSPGRSSASVITRPSECRRGDAHGALADHVARVARVALAEDGLARSRSCAAPPPAASCSRSRSERSANSGTRPSSRAVSSPVAIAAGIMPARAALMGRSEQGGLAAAAAQRPRRRASRAARASAERHQSRRGPGSPARARPRASRAHRSIASPGPLPPAPAPASLLLERHVDRGEHRRARELARCSAAEATGSRRERAELRARRASASSLPLGALRSSSCDRAALEQRVAEPLLGAAVRRGHVLRATRCASAPRRARRAPRARASSRFVGTRRVEVAAAHARRRRWRRSSCAT